MSADDTIAVLVTKRRDGQKGCEYRVAYAQALENITYEPDYPSADYPRLNRKMVLEYFGEARIHLNEEEALQEALKLEEEWGGCEYGVCEVEHSKVYFPASDRKRKRNRRRRSRHGAKCSAQQASVPTENAVG